MEKNSAKILEVKTTQQIVEEARKYIKDRHKGTERSIKVKSDRINKAFMDGFDWNRIITIAGLSGSGKSTLVRQWLKEFIECNPEEEFDVLAFQFEMIGADEIARDVSSKIQKPVKDIYSAGDAALTEAELKKIDAILDGLRDYPIYVVDNLGTVSEIKDTIVYYMSTNKLIERKRGLIVTLDHTLLIKSEDVEDDKRTLDNFYRTLVLLKKYFASKGGKILFIALSQLNRNIESTERVTNPKLHYPNKNDLFGSSSVYFSSDYVIIMHRPCLIDGIGNWYGPPRKNMQSGLPVYATDDETKSLIYFHIIKERFGQNKILPMVDSLNTATILDYSLK